MVYVTHDQTEAMSMADQVVLLNGGRIEQDAPPAELYARPATTFAARFIGTPPMNIVAAPRPARPRSSACAPSTCAWSSSGGWPAVVQTAEYLGADTRRHLFDIRGRHARATRWRRACPDATSSPTGAPVRLAWDAGRQPLVRRHAPTGAATTSSRPPVAPA